MVGCFLGAKQARSKVPATLPRRWPVRAVSLNLVVGIVFMLGLPGLLSAQSLQHRYSFTTDASDSVGGANGTLVGNATINNNALYLPGGGTSANPQGYVALPSGLVTNDTSISVECWLTDNAGLVWAEAWCFGDSAAGPGQPPTSGTAYISLIPHSGENDFRAAFNLTGGDEIDVVYPGGPMPMNVEQYAVLTYDAPGTTANLYLNGSLLASASIPSYLAPSNYGNTFDNWFGRDEFGGDPMFAGSIDELRIWNGAVSPLFILVSSVAGPGVLVTNVTPVSVNIGVTNTFLIQGQNLQATVSANFLQVTNVPMAGFATNWSSSNTNILTVDGNGFITAVSPGTATVSALVGGALGISPKLTVPGPNFPAPVAYYSFDGDVLDHSGNGNNGINNGATFVTPAYSSPEAAQFNGASYVQIPKSVGITGAGFTIAMWLKTTDTGGGPGWYSGEGLVDGEVAGVTTDFGTALVDGYFALGIGQPDTTLVSTNLVNDGNWHHVAATWNMNSGAMNVYVDGTLSASGVGPTGSRAAPPNLRIGSIQTGAAGGFLNGTIDEVLLYTNEFTAQQVAILENSYFAGPQVSMPAASPSNTVFSGTTVTLNAVVLGQTPLSFQWQKNGTNIWWGTSASLVLTNASVLDSGNYSLMVANAAGTNSSAPLLVTVTAPSPPFFVQQPSPANVTNYVGGFVTFTASVNGTLPIQFQWQQNGVNLPNGVSANLTLASVQLTATGSYTLMASNAFGVTNSLPVNLTVLPIPNPSTQNVLTYHNDNTRQGANTNEVLLTTANVNTATFGRLIQYPTDGYIYAQPLYVSGLVIPGKGTHNAVIVATENDTVYAFDADSDAGTNGGVLWSTNLGLAVSSYNDEFGNRYQGTYYGDIVPVVGITGTPVIDPSSGTLYVDVHTREVGVTTNYFHRIHALNITNGAEQSYSPVAVTNSVPGYGVGSSHGVVQFDPRQENQRPGMTLAGGMVYAAYGSYADTEPYHGWVIGFKATNLQTSANNAFCTTPNATVAAFGVNAAEGALWMGGDGLCADASNNLYFLTANGSFSQNTNGGDYADSFLKLSTTNGLGVADYFTPYNQASLSANDTDLGSGGDILLPDSVGSAAHPHLIVGAGKDGTLRLVDRDNMGHFNAANDNQIVQEVPGAIGGAWSTPAFFNNHIYYQGSGDVMKSFLITNGVIVGAPDSRATTSFNALGGTPSISANGTNNGIVWTLQSDAFGSGGPAVLHAYNATNLAIELYNSSMNLARDNPGSAIKMTTPTVVNGKVFVGAAYAVSIFGNSLFLATPVISPAGGLFTNSVLVTLSDATPSTCIYYTLDGTTPTTNSALYAGPVLLTNSALVQAVAAAPGAVNSAVAAASFINSAAFGSGTGLLGAYYANHTSANPYVGLPTLTRTDAVINFNWNTVGPDPSVGQTDFTVRWTGTVQPQFSGPWTFYATADDGVRLWVNGQLLIDGWIPQSPTTYQATISLSSQQLYNIEMDYFQATGGAEAMLAWSSTSTAQAIIPQTQLYPFTNPPPTVVLTAPAGSATNYTAAASVTISAAADAPYNPIGFVSFYANGNYLGSVTNLPYTITATGLAAGNYALAAVAVDGSGLSSTSAPVNITVASGSGLAYGLTGNAKVNAFLNLPTTYNGTLPALLSGTGAYSNTTNRTPAAGLIQYAPNAPQWKDNALSSWFMALPNNGGVITPGEQIQFQPTNAWTFPAGSVFVKNFDLLVNETNATVRRLETELLVRDNNGSVYGVTYKWRPDNSDADLLSGNLSEDILITNATGVRTQTWYYPSPSDCQECHNSATASNPSGINVLGVNARQLNSSLTYPATGVTDNQLRTLNRLGLFNPAINEAAIGVYSKLSAMTNVSVSLQERVRSYLDVNCEHCHQPGGQGITWDARYDTPLAQQDITNYPAAFSLGISDHACIVKNGDIWRSVLVSRLNTLNQDIQMPDFRNLIDTNAVAVITAWINSLPGTPALAPPAITPNGGSFLAPVKVTLTAPATNATIYYTLDGSLPTTNSQVYAGVFTIATNTTVSASAFATNCNNSVAVSALFLVQPLYFSTVGFLPNQQFQLGLVGLPGSNYVLLATTNFLNWVPVSTNSAVANPVQLLDPQATNFPRRFYRVRQQ
jgi:hypothetical protein